TFMFSSLLQHLAGTRLVRRTADALFGKYARRRARKLDEMNSGDIQRETLLRLVQCGRDTRFGRDHDFAGISSVEDYRKRVPLRDYDTFWNDYLQPAFPHVQGVTWPGGVPYFALSSGTTTGSTKYIPVSAEMLKSNRRAALTSLALLRAAYPNTPLFSGRMFFLGGSTDLQPLHNSKILAGDLSGIAAREVPSLLRPFTFPPLEIALLRDWDRKLDLLARR